MLQISAEWRLKPRSHHRRASARRSARCGGVAFIVFTRLLLSKELRRLRRRPCNGVNNEERIDAVPRETPPAGPPARTPCQDTGYHAATLHHSTDRPFRAVFKTAAAAVAQLCADGPGETVAEPARRVQRPSSRHSQPQSGWHLRFSRLSFEVAGTSDYRPPTAVALHSTPSRHSRRIAKKPRTNTTVSSVKCTLGLHGRNIPGYAPRFMKALTIPQTRKHRIKQVFTK